MNPRTTRTLALTAGGGAVAVALWLTVMGFDAQERQYRKSLRYMHEGRERGAARMRGDTSSRSAGGGGGEK